ncbi:MAG TPA: ATP synthase F1 subunit epsilon [Pirellulales bacterium]|jgi:F-type H+-transporting ATPase subunit epsilon|nr:ATP synthase F1 subunit epsilon [Pirellulales bacterium]
MEHHDKSQTRTGQLQLVVVTPEATVLDETAQFVALPLYDGEIGIAPLHSPMIGRLGYGEMRVKHGDRVSRYYVDGGFVQVVDDVVSVLTARAVAASSVDAGVAGEQLAEARRRPANTPELMALRDRAELQARAQLRVARHAGNV